MTERPGSAPDAATAPEQAAAMALAVAAAVGPAAEDGRPAAAAEALQALATLHRLRGLLTEWEPRLIEEARAAGVSWARLAPVLGVTSRQAAERRYLRLRPGVTEGMTGEDRVRAARDERAGERAVAGWARDHASHLRQVAGQASGVAGLGSTARRRARELRDSLDRDDPSALLAPLEAMHEHLIEDHDALAEKVEAIAHQAERVRRDTQRRRERATDS